MTLQNFDRKLKTYLEIVEGELYVLALKNVRAYYRQPLPATFPFMLLCRVRTSIIITPSQRVALFYLTESLSVRCGPTPKIIPKKCQAAIQHIIDLEKRRKRRFIST